MVPVPLPVPNEPAAVPFLIRAPPAASSSRLTLQIMNCRAQHAAPLHRTAYVLEQYEPYGKRSRRFEVFGGAEGVTYDTAGAYLLGRDVRENALDKATALVKDFVGQVADEYHPVVNTILREENRVDSETRRREVFKLIEGFRKGLA